MSIHELKTMNKMAFLLFTWENWTMTVLYRLMTNKTIRFTTRTFLWLLYQTCWMNVDDILNVISHYKLHLGLLAHRVSSPWAEVHPYLFRTWTKSDIVWLQTSSRSELWRLCFRCARFHTDSEDISLHSQLNIIMYFLILTLNYSALTLHRCQRIMSVREVSEKHWETSRKCDICQILRSV